MEFHASITEQQNHIIYKELTELQFIILSETRVKKTNIMFSHIYEL